jgi:hypothetical protein
MQLLKRIWRHLHARRGAGALSCYLRRDIGIQEEYEKWHDWNM